MPKIWTGQKIKREGANWGGSANFENSKNSKKFFNFPKTDTCLIITVFIFSHVAESGWSTLTKN